MLRAPAEDIRDWIDKRAVLSNLPARKQGGKHWSCYQALSFASQRSIEEHEQALVAAGCSERAAVFSNLSQRPHHMGPQLNGMIPALLRRSQLWSFRLRRVPLPQELLEVIAFWAATRSKNTK